ncbi:MAG: malate permease [Solirubrobacterales bacterium]|nr:malate permease [Solirubrobacterales bacterium]
MILIVLAIVAATSAGLAAERRWGERAQRGAQKALLATLYFVVPVVVYFNLARAHIDVNAGGGVLLGYVALGVTVTVAYLVSTRLLHLSRPATGAVMCCALQANTGFLGYPMLVALLGSHALSEGVVYDVLTQTPTLLLGGFAIGAAFGEKAGEGARERAVAFLTRNPPLYAAIVALLVPDALAPDALVHLSRILVFAILPLGFFAVGVALAAEAEVGALRVPPPLTRPVASVLAMRLVLAPGLLLLLALPLIDLPGPYLLLAAMPSGINTMLIAHAYGLDLRITAEAVTWSTAIVVAAGLAASLLL